MPLPPSPPPAPRPSCSFKALIGGGASAYPVELSLPPNTTGVRVFAFSPAAPTNGSLALLAVHTRSSSDSGAAWPPIAVSLGGDTWPFASAARVEYHLTSANVSARHGPVLCNGELLAVDPETNAPQPWQSLGVAAAAGSPLVLAPASVTFVTLLAQ